MTASNSRPRRSLLLRGRWRAVFLAGVVAGVWTVGYYSRWWMTLHVRAYRVDATVLSSIPLPRQGTDCRVRSSSLGSISHEVARSLRIGDLVFELTQQEDWETGRSILRGPDCR